MLSVINFIEFEHQVVLATYRTLMIGAKVVLVMGHTACGAIKGAIDNVELGNLTGLLAKIKPAVAATKYEGDRSAKNYAFVDLVAKKNVELTIGQIREKSSVLRELGRADLVIGSVLIPGARRLASEPT